MTIVFGDTSSSVYDFSNDRRLDVDFTKINILLAQGETRTEEIAGNAPYLLVFNEKLEIADLEFVDAELNIKYSTFYSENLMENAASDDISISLVKKVIYPSLQWWKFPENKKPLTQRDWTYTDPAG